MDPKTDMNIQLEQSQNPYPGGGYDQPADPPLYTQPMSRGGYDQPPYEAHYGQQQPGNTMVVINQQPGPTSHYTVMPEPTAHWSTNVCGCADDCVVCCCGCFCGLCMLCDVAALLNENQCFACCYPSIALPMMRAKLRLKYGIQGSLADDCCVSCCCFTCVLCQLKRQLKTMANGGLRA